MTFRGAGVVAPVPVGLGFGSVEHPFPNGFCCSSLRRGEPTYPTYVEEELSDNKELERIKIMMMVPSFNSFL